MDHPKEQEPYNYSGVSPSIVEQMMTLEGVISQIDKWPVLGSKVPDKLASVTGSTFFDTYNLYDRARRQGIISLIEKSRVGGMSIILLQIYSGHLQHIVYLKTPFKQLRIWESIHWPV